MQTEACDEMAAHVNAICRGGTLEKPVVAGVISDSFLSLTSGKEYDSQAGLTILHPVARWSPMLGEDHFATSWVWAGYI